MTFKKGEKKPNQGKRGPDKLGHDARRKTSVLRISKQAMRARHIAGHIHVKI